MADDAQDRRLMSEALQREDEFLEYLMSLPAASTTESRKPPALARSTSAALATQQPSKAGLDHLDNLCKLMEQLGSLKEQNTKLQRRVQYLEDLKSLQQMHKQLQHDRRLSQQQRLDNNQSSEAKAKVSKWTKVKEAFRWERASLVAAAEQQQQPKRAPSSSSSESSSEDLDVHLTFSDVFPDVGSHHGSTSVPGSRSQGLELRRLSLAEEATEEEARRSRSLDGDTLSNQLPGKDVSPLSKSPSGKAHRTPWGKVKDIIIQTRKDSLKRRTGDQETGDSVPSDLDNDALVKRAAPRLTLTLPSSEELRSPTPQDRLHKTSTSSSAAEDEDRRTHVSASPPTNRRHSSKWTKVKKAFLTARQEDLGSGPNSPRDATSFVFPQNGDSEEVAPVADSTNNNIQAEIQRSYEELQQKLSLEFHNKLAEWERIKGVPSTSQPAAQYCGETSVMIPDHPLLRTPQDKCFRRKMEEWERLKQQNKQHDHLSADFRKKLNEWQRLKKVEPKGGRRQLWERRERALSAGDSEESPRTARKGKDKELMWLEKELHKIAREKQRLERERDKFLQREARLERMRRAMRSGHEVLVQTSTGSFRFHGISETFTRRLYEWEQARGIGPEDSTFALLDPGYRPQPVPKVGQDGSDGPLLSRSKSAGSVTNMANTLTRQASSLSLNDVEVLEAATLEAEARAISDPHLRSDATTDDEEGPSAVIVDVEDEVVETAAPLAVSPAVRGHTPVYCYAPREVDRLIDSSGREEERPREGAGVQRNESVRTENSYRLLEENMDLLEKLRNNEDICRKLEKEIEDLETKMADAAQSREQQLHNLETAEEGRQVALLRARVRELERRQERLKRQGASLQDSIAARSEQQALLASHLVGNMKQLQENNVECTADPIAVVQQLSSQLLELSEKLEAAVNSRSKGTRRHRLASGLTWLSADGFSLSVDSLEKSESLTCRPDLGELPALLTSKVLELKKGLNFLCPADQADEEQRTADVAKPVNRLGYCATSETNVTALVPKRESEIDHEAASSPNRDSFCSAMSSTSLVDSSSEDLKNDINEEAGNDERTKKTSAERRATLVKTRSHGSTDESDNTEGEDEVDLNSNCVHEQKDNTNPRHINEVVSEDLSRNNSYDMEVILPIKLSKTGGRSKKLLKTRRISDTHVGYKNLDSTACEKGNNESDNTDDEIVSDNWEEKPAKEKGHARNSKLCDVNSNIRKGRDATKYQKPNELDERGNNVGSQFVEQKKIGSKVLDEELAVPSANLESSAESGSTVDGNSNESINAQSNIFVKTTRKIFSPVRRDSKGKTSSVISFVVGETDGNRWPHRQENGDKYSSDGQNIPSPGASMKTPPAWMLRRSRSQSSSPAMIRRRPTVSTHDDAAALGSAGPKESTDENLSKETHLNKKNNLSLKEQTRKLDNSEDGKGADQTADKISSPDIQSSPGLPPLSQSPNPNRRDFLKMVSKETAPSIRMMIAKYNQKLEHSVGGRSPENSGPSAGGSASPVAWRSPVTERRVRTQMEKYQEEVRRALEQGSRKSSASRVEVQKSASAGFIPNSETNKNCRENYSKPPSVTVQRSGILKSSSAGCIKPAFSTSFLPSGNSESSRGTEEAFKPIIPPPEPFNDAPKESPAYNESKVPKFPSATTSTSSPSSPELRTNSAEKSPPLSRLRALRLKRAKEEFLTRGPGSQSWNSDSGTPAVSDDVKRSRLSQISVCSSESDSSRVTLRNSNPKQEEDETQMLQKSASAGMINVEDGPRIVENAKTNSKFGIASIASRFRKVKMRKNRNDSNKMNTVSALCRQSLLVDLGERNRERVAAPSSKSCPSSPVLQRPTNASSSSPVATTSNDDDSRTSCWVKKKIFGPRC